MKKSAIWEENISTQVTYVERNEGGLIIGVSKDRSSVGDDQGTYKVPIADEDQLKRKVAAFTIVQDEPIFLPLWLKHHHNAFEGKADLYFLDHDSTIFYGNDLPAKRIPVHRSASFDHNWLVATVSAFQVFLLQSYEYVMFTEADELVAANPEKYHSLWDYINRWPVPTPIVQAEGISVVHKTSVEPPIDLSMPILGQRQYGVLDGSYDKAVFSKIPLKWGVGFHNFENQDPHQQDKDLKLFHLHGMDLGVCLDRHKATSSKKWRLGDVKAGWGSQNRETDEEKIKATIGFNNDYGKIVPDTFKGIF